MTPTRPLTPAALFAALALAVGCGKKAAPEPEVVIAPDPKSGPADPAAAEREAKAEAVERLQQVGLAVHHFESTYGHLPAGIARPEGGPDLLSWRVQILPYLGKDERELFGQFRPGEPWDGEHNRKLIPKMPKPFASPGKATSGGKTHLRSFAGPAAIILFPPGPYGNKRLLNNITDGMRDTLMAAEAAEPVEWTKPEELPFLDQSPARVSGAKDLPPVPKLGGVFPSGFHGLMCDGSVRFCPDTLNEKTLRALISVHLGDVITQDAPIISPPAPRPAALPTNAPDDLLDAHARKTAVARYQAIFHGLRAHNEAVGHLPAGLVAKGAVGLSWRVEILPYLGQQKLYAEFRLDEPWDSEHNKTLIPKMPSVFASAGKAAPEGHTFVLTTEGAEGFIRTTAQNPSPPGTSVRGRPLAQVPDGTAYTILLAEAAEAVPWTKPGDLPVSPRAAQDPDPVSKLPKLGGAFADGFHAVMADGRVTFYKTGYPAVMLAKLFDHEGGSMIDPLAEREKIGYSSQPPEGAPKKKSKK